MAKSHDRLVKTTFPDRIGSNQPTSNLKRRHGGCTGFVQRRATNVISLPRVYHEFNENAKETNMSVSTNNVQEGVPVRIASIGRESDLEHGTKVQRFVVFDHIV